MSRHTDPTYVELEHNTEFACQWAEDQFGRATVNGSHSGWNYIRGGRYAFYNQQDAMLFLLKFPGKTIDFNYAMRGCR